MAEDLEWNLVLRCNLVSKSVVLALQRQREGGIVSALHQHWTAGLPNKGVARACPDTIKHGPHVHSGPLTDHEDFSHCLVVDAGQHVGQHLGDESCAHLAGVDHVAVDRLHQGHILVRQRLLPSKEHSHLSFPPSLPSLAPQASCLPPPPLERSSPPSVHNLLSNG